MKSYAERVIFEPFTRVVYKRAALAVALVPDHYGNELRCHKLARAVHRLLDVPRLRIADGKLGAVEHSWLELVLDTLDPRIGGCRRAIVDVYTPGRMPQVQLIDTFPLLKHAYEEGTPRTDIREEMVQTLYDEMRKGWLEGRMP